MPVAQDNELDVAVASLKKLEALHSHFMTLVAQLSASEVNGGRIGVIENELIADCLGTKLTTKHRVISRDGSLMAVEYAFEALHKDEPLHIWSIYLEADGSLYIDPVQGERLCDSGNAYLATYLIPKIASALLRSAAFAPTRQQ